MSNHKLWHLQTYCTDYSPYWCVSYMHVEIDLLSNTFVEAINT